MDNQQRLPVELLMTEVFSRLPVKSLLRFKSLSKPICSTIDSPDFIKLHITNSLTHNLNLLITDRHRDEFIMSFDFNDSLTENNYVNVLLQNPLKTQPQHAIKRMGLCNGILCLVRSDGDIALLNTATRKHHILPHLSQGLLKDRCCVGAVFCYGFGYDHLNDDYKVVRIAQFTDIYAKCMHCEVMIYSLKQNAWRKVTQDFPYSLTVVHNSSAFVSGNMHFQVEPISQLAPVLLIHKRAANMIVAFDFSMENYNVVPLPHSLLSRNIHLNFTVLGGCLCVIPITNRAVRGDIWVMKEYGVKDSWVKLFSVVPEGKKSNYPDLLPVAFSTNGNKVLLEISGKGSQPKRLAWYDLKKKKMKFANKLNKMLPHIFFADVTVESLVSLEIAKQEGITRLEQQGKEEDKFELVFLIWLTNCQKGWSCLSRKLEEKRLRKKGGLEMEIARIKNMIRMEF
ncbi:hypothetical protein ACFE04_007827 [Oxalis oulophora]